VKLERSIGDKRRGKLYDRDNDAREIFAIRITCQRRSRTFSGTNRRAFYRETFRGKLLATWPCELVVVSVRQIIF